MSPAKLGDPDKIEALLVGGVSERHFRPHQNDPARLRADGQRCPWWFNPAKAQANAKHKVVLSP